MKSGKVKIGLIFLAIVLLMTSNARAETRFAASCSQSDVQAQVSAASDGDTVSIPAGSCNWGTSTLGWSDKNINVIGAGPTSTAISFTGNAIWVGITNSTKGAFRISGIGFSGSPSGQTINIEGRNLRSPVYGFRLDHLTMNYATSGDIIRIVGGPIWGLIDHVSMTLAAGVPVGIIQADYYDSEYGNSPMVFMGETSARLALGLGTQNAVYIEDSEFHYTNYRDYFPILDSSSGGQRTVFRHNTLTGGCLLYSHWSRGGEWDGHKYEIYNNSFDGAYTGGGGSVDYPIRFESGTGVFFNNTVKNYTNGIMLILDDRRGGGGEASAPALACNGTHAWDGNAGDASAPGWPCMGQIGTGCIAGGCTRSTMDNVPFLIWHNGVEDGCSKGGPCTTTGTTVNVTGSDAYIKATPHTATRYNQAVDYCIGGSSMPSTCGTYTNTYAAYTYPHPLQRDALGSPLNLRIIQ